MPGRVAMGYGSQVIDWYEAPIFCCAQEAVILSLRIPVVPGSF
jgi:hypothetical protein